MGIIAPSQIAKAGMQIAKLKEREIYEGSLIEFAKYVWPVVEPAIPFVRGWAIDAIAEHLQAVTEGHIKRLLINVPPGFTKSLMTDVFWPAWEWANDASIRWLFGSYDQKLATRDAMKMRLIVESPWFKTLNGSEGGGVGTQDLYLWSDARKYGYRCAIDCSIPVGHYDHKSDMVW
jgi:hypothetical protein